MPKAIDPGQEYEYILSRERSEPKPTRFRFRWLTVRERMAIKDRARVTGVDAAGNVACVSVNIESMLYDYASTALNGWFDFYDGAEKPVRFTRGNLERLSQADIKELGKHVMETNELTEDEEKNSSSAPVS